MSENRQRLLRARQLAQEQLAAPAAAFSIDGRTFHFQAPIDFKIGIGSYVAIVSPAGKTCLGQIQAKEPSEYSGPQIAVAGSGGIDFGNEEVHVTSTTYTIRMQAIRGTGALLARFEGGTPHPLTAQDTFADSSLEEAPAEMVAAFVHGQSARRGPLDIGSLRTPYDQVRSQINATGFDRHTFLCGQSGSGKTYSLGVVLERLLQETNLRIVILDPNSDFVRLHETSTFEEVGRAFTDTHADETSFQEAIAKHKRAIEGAHILRPTPRGTTNENALRIWFSDLVPDVQGMVLKLDPVDDLEEFSAFLSIRNQFGAAQYSVSDVREAAARDFSPSSRQLALRISNLGVDRWDVWAERGESLKLSTGDSSQRLTVLDIGGFSLPDEQSLVALATLNSLWHRRNDRQPLLLVIDEAHTICPSEASRPLLAAAVERAVQIAGEGRKFGIYLLVSTQRPQKLHPNVISQCDNLILMRMNSEADVESLAETFSFVPQTLLNAATGFVQGESLIAGKLVSSPTMIRFGGRYSKEGGSDIATDWANA